jgi:hypothetical protein
LFDKKDSIRPAESAHRIENEYILKSPELNQGKNIDILTLQ